MAQYVILWFRMLISKTWKKARNIDSYPKEIVLEHYPKLISLFFVNHAYSRNFKRMGLVHQCWGLVGSKGNIRFNCPRKANCSFVSGIWNTQVIFAISNGLWAQLWSQVWTGIIIRSAWVIKQTLSIRIQTFLTLIHAYFGIARIGNEIRPQLTKPTFWFKLY